MINPANPHEFKTQNSIALAVLMATPNEFVSAAHLQAMVKTLCVHSVMSNLRKLGYNIENKMVRVDGHVESSYRIVTAHTVAA